MPKYVLVARDGREASSSRMFSTSEVNAYRGAPSCYTFINELTNKVKNVGACRTHGGRLRDGVPPAGTKAPAPAAAPAAKPVAGWWPFTKKKPKINPMTKRMIWVSGETPRVMDKFSINPMTRAGRQILGRARRKRRRR